MPSWTFGIVWAKRNEPAMNKLRAFPRGARRPGRSFGRTTARTRSRQRATKQDRLRTSGSAMALLWAVLTKASAANTRAAMEMAVGWALIT